MVNSQWTNSDLVYYKERIKGPYRLSRCRNVSMFTHELEHISMYDAYILYLILRISIPKPYPALTTEQVRVHLRKKSALIPTSL